MYSLYNIRIFNKSTEAEQIHLCFAWSRDVYSPVHIDNRNEGKRMSILCMHICALAYRTSWDNWSYDQDKYYFSSNGVEGGLYLYDNTSHLAGSL